MKVNFFQNNLEEWVIFLIKGTISDSVILNPKLHYFPNPQILLHIQEEIHYNKLHVEQFPRKQHIFGKTDNFLLLGINYRRR